MDGLAPYRARIEPEWIDYNGHLRDAYYGVVFSHAIDDFMEQIGLDAAYRESTRCTLYTLETHFHYLHEVKSSDTLTVRSLVLDSDRKRILAAGLFTCDRIVGPVAAAEAVLLHVRQGERPASAPFPAAVETRLAALNAEAAPEFPRSRKLELPRRPGA